MKSYFFYHISIKFLGSYISEYNWLEKSQED